MRATNRHRPLRRELVSDVGSRDLVALAERCVYVGSVEHKTYPSFAGDPAPRSDATKCDPAISNQEELTKWLRSAVRAGQIGAPWEGDFPRYAWFRTKSGAIYEARLVNREQGHYKGYELDPHNDKLPNL